MKRFLMTFVATIALAFAAHASPVNDWPDPRIEMQIAGDPPVLLDQDALFAGDISSEVSRTDLTASVACPQQVPLLGVAVSDHRRPPGSMSVVFRPLLMTIG